MAFMEPQSLQPLPRYYYSPTYRGAATDVHGKIVEPLHVAKPGVIGSALKNIENIFTAGERLSGTSLYRARKGMGFGEIEYLEEKIAQGKGWKISPSQALGIAEFGDKRFELLRPSTWSAGGAARGTVAFGADIFLDPITWMTLGTGGLAKIGAKGVTKIGGTALLARGGTRVGAKGTQFIEAAVSGGMPRAAAERNLIRYMATSPEAKEWSLSGGARMIQFGTRAHHVDLMRTSLITEPAGQLWRAAPLLGSRTRAWDMLNVGLGSRYYRFTQAMGRGAERPFQQYHRETEVATAMMRKELAEVGAGVPYGSEDIIRRAMEIGGKAPAAESRAAKQYAAISKRWWTEARGVGIIKEEQYLESYVYHMATPEFKKWMGERKGSAFDPNIPMPEYAKRLGWAKGRTALGDIDAINEFFMKMGAPKALETDIYKIMLARGTAHTKAMAYAKLEQRATTTWGRPAMQTVVAKHSEEAYAQLLRDSDLNIAMERGTNLRKISKLQQTLDTARGHAAYSMLKFDIRSMQKRSMAEAKEIARVYDPYYSAQERLAALTTEFETYGVEKLSKFETETTVLREAEMARVSAKEVGVLAAMRTRYARLPGARPVSVADVKRYEAIELEKFGRWKKTQHTVSEKAYYRAQTELGLMRSAYSRGAAAPSDLLTTKEAGVFRKLGVSISSRQRAIDIGQIIRLPDWDKARRIKERALQEQIMRGRGVLQGKIWKAEDVFARAEAEYFEMPRFAKWETQELKRRVSASSRFAAKEMQMINVAEEALSLQRAKYAAMESGVGIREASALAKARSADVLSPEQARVFGGETFHLLKRVSGEETYLPIPVLEELQRPAARYGEGVIGNIMREWQKRESQMKAGMTVAWPAFFARNIQGGIFQNILAGVGIKGYTRAFDMLARTSDYWGVRQLRKFVDLPETKLYDVPYRGKMTAREMRDLMEQEQVIQVTGRMDVPLDTRVGPIQPGMQHKLWNWLTSKYPQTGMTGTEAIVRAPLFMHEMFAGKTVRAAEEEVGKFHFRYGAGEMTDFENLVMKRLFPFWTWTRHNIRLQTEMALTQPGKYATLMKAQRRAVPEEDRARMKDWMRGRFGFTAGETFVAVDLPVGELPGLYGREDVAFGLSPMIKAPIGLIMQRDVMAGRPIAGDTKMELVKANVAFALTSFLPRFGHTQRELSKTLAGERPLSWTVAHQFGGVGIYEMPPSPMYTGMTTMPRMPSGVRAMGLTQENWTEYKMARGWTPQLTDVSRAEVYQQHGGKCSVCGRPCSPEHPCSSQLIVPAEMGGTYSPDNTVLVCSSCSGTFRHDVAPMMRQSMHGTQVPTEYKTGFTDRGRDEIYGIIDSYMNDASLVE